MNGTLFWTVAVLCLAFAFHRWYRVEPAPYQQWNELLHGDYGVKVQRTPWPSGASSASEVISMLKSHQPFVLRNTPADFWKASQLWTPEYIHERVFELERVQISRSHPLYEYHNAAPLGTLMTADTAALATSSATEPKILLQPGSFQKVDMSTTDFFEACLRENVETASPPFVYYAGNFGGNHPILSDVGSPNDFFMDRVAAETGSGKPPVYYVWMGNKGVVAHAHLDNVYNFYIQIYGRKRFVLFPPALFDVLQMYPKLHPRNGQSQINFTAPQADRFPDFLTAETQRLIHQHARVADLQPGDVLILPPYWLHYVTATELSISVSLWAYAEAVAVYANVTEITIPMHRDWEQSERIAALGFYMMSLFEQLAPSSDTTSPTSGVSTQSNARILSKQRLHQLLHGRYQSFHAVSAFNHAPFNGTKCAVTGVAEMTALREAAGKAAAKLNTLPPFVRDAFAFDYVEELLNTAVQPAHVFATLVGFGASC